MVAAPTLSSEAALDATEDVLRRYGPGKASVVDVARALGVSHGSVYRHFRSKADLRDAVTERWLRRITVPLEEIADRPAPAGERLREWVFELSSSKRELATSDLEMFETFRQLTRDAREVVAAHVDRLVGMLARIIADGMAAGEFREGDAAVIGRAVLHATERFHHPAFFAEWGDPSYFDDLEAVFALIAGGLRR